MILKIFTKRKPGGQLINTGFDWHNQLIDASHIATKVINSTAFITTVTGEGEFKHVVDLDTHGYEVMNDAGVTVEKFVTVIKEK